MNSFTGIVWVDNSTPRANWWGDISALIIGRVSSSFPTYAHGIVGHIQFRTTMLFQLPISSSLNSSNLLHLCDPISPLYDFSARKRHRIFDISVTMGAPVVGYLIHLSNMDRRFYIIERLGPQAATYWNAWGVIWMAMVPILIALIVAVYTGEQSSLMRFVKCGSHISSHGSR